jgi:hypothetical protein
MLSQSFPLLAGKIKLAYALSLYEGFLSPLSQLLDIYVTL